MIRFNSDYTEGCHTAILEKLVENNMEQTAGYGEDEYCGQARELIRKACGDERVDVHFLVGGTQANTTITSFNISDEARFTQVDQLRLLSPVDQVGGGRSIFGVFFSRNVFRSGSASDGTAR